MGKVIAVLMAYNDKSMQCGAKCSIIYFALPQVVNKLNLEL